MSQPVLRTIVLIDRYLPILGGAQKNVHQICVGLVNKGHQMKVLTRMVVPGLRKHEVLDGVEIERFSKNRVRWLSKIFCVVAFVRYLVKFKDEYDVVVCVPCSRLTDLLPAYLAALITGKPYVIRSTSTSLYDSVLDPSSGSVAGVLQRLFLPPLLWRKVLAKSETIINQSDAVRAKGLAHGFDSNLVIANGVDTNVYHPVSSDEKRALRHTMRIPEEATVIINTGRFVEAKNQIALLKVAKHFLDRGFDDFLLLLLGATEEGQVTDSKPSLLQFIDENSLQNNVLVVDDARNVEQFLQASDVFVFPTKHAEGMSNSLLEAMATGLPVVASRMDQIICVFPEDYHYFFDPESSEQLGRLLWELVESPALRESSGKRLEKHVLQNYALTASVERYETLFRGIRAS